MWNRFILPKLGSQFNIKNNNIYPLATVLYPNPGEMPMYLVLSVLPPMVPMLGP